MHTFDLATDTLRAARGFAATKDVRYYLMGVYVTDNKVIGTDGYILGVFDAPNAAGDIIIPNELVDTALKSAKKASQVTVTLDGDTVSLAVAGTTATGKRIDGTYPDWRRILPESTSGETAQYDAELLERAATALAKHYNCKANDLRLEHNGASAGVIWHAGISGAVALVMPMRSNANPDELAARLSWARK